MVKVYTAYHTDPLTHVKKEVGLVLERRKLERGNLVRIMAWFRALCGGG
jgi:hypothetical protein